jgi:hypothetical protein
MADDGALGAAVEELGALFDVAVGDRDALVLAQVLQPGLRNTVAGIKQDVFQKENSLRLEEGS